MVEDKADRLHRRRTARYVFPSAPGVAPTTGMLLAALVLFAGGCRARSDGAARGPSAPTEFGYQVTPQTALLLEGEKAYKTYCVGCHGAEGDGRGEAARFLNPRPRDFTKAQYKFISTRFGELPTDEDLYRTITHGLRGSSMPSWKHLPAPTRRALVAYIKSFSVDWDSGATPAIPFVTDPYVEMEDKSAAIARGEKAYHGFFTCWNCHPAYVSQEKISQYLAEMGGRPKESYRPNIHQTAIKADSNGETIFAPDFLRDYVKSVLTLRDLYRAIGGGITGTAMPTWIDSVAPGSAPTDAAGDLLASPADIWAMAYYVRNLMKTRQVKFAADEVVVRDNRKMRFTAEGALYEAAVEEPEAGGEVFEEEEFIDEEDE